MADEPQRAFHGAGGTSGGAGEFAKGDEKETDMAAAPRVTKETVEKMAREVAGIDLTPTEIDQLTPQLDKLLTDLAQIPDSDLQDIEPSLFFNAGEPEQT
jgi:hypothetical protein